MDVSSVARLGTWRTPPFTAAVSEKHRLFRAGDPAHLCATGRNVLSQHRKLEFFEQQREELQTLDSAAMQIARRRRCKRVVSQFAETVGTTDSEEPLQRFANERAAARDCLDKLARQGPPRILSWWFLTLLCIITLLLVVAIALAIVAIWAFQNARKADAVLAVIVGGAALAWYLLTDAAPDWLPNTMPYALVLLVLIFASQNLRTPRALGGPYRRGET